MNAAYIAIGAAFVAIGGASLAASKKAEDEVQGQERQAVGHFDDGRRRHLHGHGRGGRELIR